MRRLLVFLIEYYQKYLHSFWPESCLFFPSCSEYTKQAILKYGSYQGIFKGLKRILKCQTYSVWLGENPLK